MVKKNYHEYTDIEILEKILQLENHSKVAVELLLEEFFNRLKPILKSSILMACRRYEKHLKLTAEDLEDMIQQICIKIFADNFQVLREFKVYDDNSFKYFLFDIAHHKIIDTLRYHKASRRPVISVSLDEKYSFHKATMINSLLDNNKNPEEQFLQKERMQQVSVMLDQEKDVEKKAQDKEILMAYCEGYSLDEIAAKTNVDLKRTAINSRIQWLKNKLRDLIK